MLYEQLNGTLYKQVEGVAMGSPLGPLLANAFMCSIEEKLEEKNELPSFYKRGARGELLHYHSHVDKRYKDCLLTTMIHRAYQPSSTPTVFSDECNKLRSTFLNLNYPINLINSAINKFLRNTDTIDAATARHLHQRINEHQYSAIGRHLEQHGLSRNDLVDKQFSVLKKCRSKFDCLIFEMLFIKELNPLLITQKDSIRAKLFT